MFIDADEYFLSRHELQYYDDIQSIENHKKCSNYNINIKMKIKFWLNSSIQKYIWLGVYPIGYALLSNVEIQFWNNNVFQDFIHVVPVKRHNNFIIHHYMLKKLSYDILRCIKPTYFEFCYIKSIKLNIPKEIQHDMTNVLSNFTNGVFDNIPGLVMIIMDYTDLECVRNYEMDGELSIIPEDANDIFVFQRRVSCNRNMIEFAVDFNSLQCPQMRCWYGWDSFCVDCVNNTN